MKWPTATQAAIAAVMSGIVALLLRRSRPTRLGDVVLPAATEFALVASLYSVWRVAKKLPLTQSEGAVDRAREIVRFQDFLHLPSELSLQQFALSNSQVGWLSTAYYAAVHVPATILFLIWLFARHRDKYPHWRNALAILTAFCLFIRFIHVAPPRFVPDLGYIDLSSVYGMSVYGPVGTGVSGQFVAMPSLHVAWAGVVTFGVIAAGAGLWRYLIVFHLVATLFVVAATGHHWWLDGIVALVLLSAALKIDTGGRRVIESRRATPPVAHILDQEVASATARTFS